jgi:DNA-binding response OmpR family regulator
VPARYVDELVEIDFSAGKAKARGRPLGLSPQEMRLLTAFVHHPRQVLSSAQLLALAWGDAGYPNARVKLYVLYLREKFAAQGLDAPIETLRGFGYRYMPPAHPVEAS